MAAPTLNTIPLEIQTKIIEPLRINVKDVTDHLDSCVRRCRSLHRMRNVDNNLSSVCHSLQCVVNDSIPGVVIMNISQHSSTRYLNSGAVTRLPQEVLALRMDLDGMCIRDVERWSSVIRCFENARRLEVYGEATAHPSTDTDTAYGKLEDALGFLITRQGSRVESVFCDPPVDVARYCRESAALRSFSFDSTSQIPAATTPRSWTNARRVYINIPLTHHFPTQSFETLCRDEFPSLRVLSICNEMDGAPVGSLLQKVEDSIVSLSLFQMAPSNPPQLPLMSNLRMLTCGIHGARHLFLWHLPRLEKIVFFGFPAHWMEDGDDLIHFRHDLEDVLHLLVRRIYTPSLLTIQLRGFSSSYFVSSCITATELLFYQTCIDLCTEADISLVEEHGDLIRIDEDGFN